MPPDEGEGASSRSLFRDRREAGLRLAERLDQYRGQGVLVLAVPRGGVPVAAEVARRLGAELDVIVARKLGAPGMPELAIGAVTASGGRYLNEELIAQLGVAPAYLEAVTAAELAEARGREARFRGTRPQTSVSDRVVIVVDDGLATGATVLAAVRSLRARGPGRVVVAVPVGSPDACLAMRREADEVVCLFEPPYFRAVGLFYERFEPPEDAEVARLLDEAARTRRPLGMTAS